ncbi:MAG TPA: methionine biosynthesis protein MetW [Candidatus Desulfobacillus sp.]|nr:methionine biosynthesis protein MetW [Candidatus Desulfobacillus sp.]
MTNVLGRFDFELIAKWIRPGEKVLDLGCGDGSLLRFLKEDKGVLGYGVDNDQANVLACIGNGVNVIQIDLEAGLSGFADGFFDHVVMSLSLQTVRHTERLLAEMLRVGRQAVVSFPNFGHRSHREAIARGRMPVSKSLPYQWFNSPNVRFFTMADFEALCAERGIAIRERHAFDEGRPVTEDPNLNASIGVYRLGRAAAPPAG